MTAKKSTSRKSSKDEEVFEKTFTELAGKDNPPIDETYFPMIEAGDIQLTDDLFFRLLRESPEYLKTEPFQVKFSEWLLEDNTKMINRIKTTLKPERRGRKAAFEDNSEVKEKYLRNVKLLSDFKKKYPGKAAWELNRLFKEEYPDLNVDFKKHRSVLELAYDLSAEQLKISVETLRGIVTHTHLNAPLFE